MQRQKRQFTPKPKLNNKQDFQINQYNEDYENAKKGIVPPKVVRRYNELHPQQQNKTRVIPPFELRDISKIMVFNKDQAKKLIKASLFSRAEEYDTLRSSYQK